MNIKELKNGRYSTKAQILSFGYYNPIDVLVDIERKGKIIQIEVLDQNKLVLDEALLKCCHENDNELIIIHDDCENTIIDKTKIKLLELF